jgi:hypothetical protein
MLPKLVKPRLRNCSAPFMACLAGAMAATIEQKFDYPFEAHFGQQTGQLTERL